MKFIARVVTKEGTLSRTVIRPLIAPTPHTTRSASTTARPLGTPCPATST